MIKITKRMLDKSIIDANKEVTRFVKTYLWASYSDLQGGDRMVFTALISDGTRDDHNYLIWEDSEFRIYRRPRGDKLLSIKNLKKFAKVGDVVTLEHLEELNKSKLDKVYIYINKKEDV